MEGAPMVSDQAETAVHGPMAGVVLPADVSSGADRVGANGGRRPPTSRTAPRLLREDMPTDFAVSIAAKGGVEQILFGPRGPRTQQMHGFEETYVDIVDYIVRITHRIWEEKDLGYIYDTYRSNAQVTDGAGLKANREQMVEESIAAVNAMPDCVLYADDIVWAGNDVRGFHSSHRVVSVGRNTGWSEFGPPTGRKTALWSIANCVVSENTIVEEWLLDNTGAYVLQMGLDLFETARRFARDADPAVLAGVMTGQVERLDGQGAPMRLSPPDDNPFDVDSYLRYVLHTMWNGRNLAVVDRAYASNVRMHAATGREFYGRGDVKSFVLSLMTMFPDLAFFIDEIWWMGNDIDGYKTSVRWSIVGTHRGPGVYGPPTGKRARTWGISQHVIRDQMIVEEWTVFNEFELLQQLYHPEALR